MFVGHYSAAFLAKHVAPQISLPAYFVACQLIDFLWGILVLLDIEKVRFIPQITATNSLDLYFMPFTHSLPAAIIWSLGIATLYWLVAKQNPQRVRNAILLGVVVSSHWVFDFFVHRPDLPLWYDSFKVGLALWNFKVLELLLELALLWISVILALRVANENRRRYIVLAIIMTAFQFISLILSPSASTSLALQLLGSYSFLTLLSYWSDKSRDTHAARDLSPAGT